MRLKDITKNHIFYLASRSPRRRWLLSYLPVRFEVLDLDNEHLEQSGINSTCPHKTARINSWKKADNAAGKKKDGFIIACDTVVLADGSIIEKPKDKNDAFRALTMLSNKTHSVISGLTVINPERDKYITESEETQVTFRKLGTDEINKYIDSGEPFGKAGSYALQGNARHFLREIKGTKSNVYGLPLKTLILILLRMC